MAKIIAKLPVALSFVLAAALCVKGLREPDVWWQIRTGEWILENLRVPDKDIFSYTHEGKPWINVKWGAELIFALISSLLGPEGVLLLQLIVSVCMLYMTYRITLLLTGESSGYLSLAFALNAPLMLLIAEYRFIGRPEMFSHLLTLVFLYILLKGDRENTKVLWWLIPLQIAWANLHEAYATGVVLSVCFAVPPAATWLYHRFHLKDKKAKPPVSWLLLPLVLMLVTVVHPYSFAMLARPLQIFGQVFENKYTTELLDITRVEYWRWNVYALIIWLLTGVLTFVYWQKQAAAKRKFNFYWRYGTGYLLVIVAFLYLAATAYRNVIFAALVCSPALTCITAEALKRLVTDQRWLLRWQITATVALIVIYVWVVSGTYYRHTNSRDTFGIRVPEDYNPVETAHFLRAAHVSGRCFSDYLTSSYLLWALKPHFKTFIDLRDLDVFSSDFFQQFAEIVTVPEKFERADSIWGFHYVVLYRPQFAALHRHLYRHAQFRLAHLDPVAAVYMRNGDTTRAVHFTGLPRTAGYYISKIFNPLYEPAAMADADVVKAAYYLMVGDVEKAALHGTKVLAAGNRGVGYQLLGEICYNTRDYQRADSFYRLSLQADARNASAWLGLGAVLFQNQHYIAALEAFDNAIRYDAQPLQANLFAAECCKMLMPSYGADATVYLEKAIRYYRAADRLNPQNPVIMLQLGLLYAKNRQCGQAVRLLQKIRAFEGFSQQERMSIQQALTACGG
ncbi:MAG: hypothetical protein NZM35_10095 [Chitinophagales bacterium]|nr:hypothetical protein [Chitinophagales bacterium]MDW8419627.1 hypothetical protein [Chitinophagales bacterium]